MTSGVPGSNLLADAFELIETQPMQYLKYASRALNEVGQYVSSFDAPVPVEGSIQAVPRSKYQMMGLDFQKFYVQIYVELLVVDLQRGMSGDQFIDDATGIRYQIESETDWFYQDGWVSALAIRIKGTA